MLKCKMISIVKVVSILGKVKMINVEVCKKYIFIKLDLE